MSLKAKIEAVIYAAEEPVTLAQLAALFQGDVLEVIAARKGAEKDAEARTDVVSHPIEPTALDRMGHPVLAEGPAFQGRDLGNPDEKGAEGSGEVVSHPIEPTALDKMGHPVLAEDLISQGRDVGHPGEDEKKAARQRDREIREELRRILDALILEYAQSDRGMEIREIAGGYRVATKPEYHDAVRGFVKSLKPPMKLSLQALETLAVIAYKQPITAPEVGEIRGVDSGGVLGSLVSRKLITTAGRKQVIGRPILYKTTKEFLLRFGLKDLNELPSIEEFEKMAGELADAEDIAPSGGDGTEISKPELLFQPDPLAPGPLEPGEDESMKAGGAEDDSDDAEARAAAVAAIGVSDESDAEGDADVPGVVVEVEVNPVHLADGYEAGSAAGQPGEGD